MPRGVLLVEALAEGIRWGAYGIFLGLTYPVFRARGMLPVVISSDRAPMLAESPVE
jgi:hypothetical protein